MFVREKRGKDSKSNNQSLISLSFPLCYAYTPGVFPGSAEGNGARFSTALAGDKKPGRYQGRSPGFLLAAVDRRTNWEKNQRY